MPPLHGLRVIDLTRVLAGPYCAMLLGDMGAEVIKVEEPVHGDDTRAWAPFQDGVSTFFLGMNRSKKSVALDLKTPDGADTLRRLIRTADVWSRTSGRAARKSWASTTRPSVPGTRSSSTVRSPATASRAQSATCPVTTRSSKVNPG